MTAPTPGPWAIRGRNRAESRTAYDIGGDGRYVCTAHGLTPEEAYANALVIAAAPDLLAALASLFDLSVRFNNRRIEIDCESFADGMNRVHAARAALAKARP